MSNPIDMGTMSPDSSFSIPPSLSSSPQQSYFKLVTKGCNAFRILLAGSAGSGKTTLVDEVFDFDEDNTPNIQHFAIGEHDINKPILSTNNKALILHDSKGLETGSDTNSQTIEQFLGGRADLPLDEQVHAIWYCVEIPLGGERLFEGGEIKLFTAIRKTNPNIPLVVVFTKLDKLEFREKQRLRKEYKSKGFSLQDAIARTQEEYMEASKQKYTESCLKILNNNSVLKDWARYTFVSIKQPVTIVRLIELTKNMLSESEALSILFAKAQMADVNLKVTLSLRAAKNMLRLPEAKPGVRQASETTVRNVLKSIHADILSIWNMKDPQKILSADGMSFLMVQQCTEPSLSPLSQAKSSSAMSQMLAGFVALSLKPDAEDPKPKKSNTVSVLDDTERASREATRVVIAYTIDLTLALENLHWVLHSRKDKTVSLDDAVDAFSRYIASDQRAQVYQGIHDFIADGPSGGFSLQAVLKKINALAEANRRQGLSANDP